MAEIRVKETGTIKLFESDNTSSVTIASPASLGADRTITLPDASVTLASGTMLATDGSGASLTALNASELGSGTVPDARFPATLPAASGVNLTSLTATNLGSGTVPTARLGSGTASGSTILYGDNTWAAAAGGGKLLQVVNTSQGSSSGDTARTVIDQAITLDSADNSCLVSVTFTVLRNSGSTTAYGGFYVTGGGLGATTSGMVFSGAPLYTLGVGARVGWAATKLDDTPGSTTPTYGFYFAGGADFNIAYSQITVMEISA